MQDFANEVSALIRERDTLRATVKAQAETIGTLKRQYDDLAGDHSAIVANYETRLHAAYTERDRAERARSEINIILRTAAEQITQGLRAMIGDATAERPAEPPRNTTVAPLHAPGNHPALIRAIDGGTDAHVSGKP